MQNQIGKRYSFFQLFEEENYNIQVPIIQRDYAQGRKSQSEVRELFLQALYDYLEAGIPNRDLDFVYGSTVHSVSKTFIPLDGQQRLTTLFLLHWYLANISGKIDFFKSYLFDTKKSRFSYLTRTSSGEFCNALLENDVDISNLLESKENPLEHLSETIKNSCWYFLSWSKDPTIQAMLTMLDSIHEKFKKRPDFFEKLIDKLNPIITFLYLDLKEFGLTEDLYIKMNSRGKPLTTFENFKAKLEQHIKANQSANKFPLSFGNITKVVNTQEYFSFNIDTKWANLFWQYRDLGGNNSTFDDELMNFIYVIASNQCAVEKDYIRETFQYLNKADNIDFDTPEYISYNKLNALEVLTPRFIDYLIAVLDNLSNGDKKIKQYLETASYFDEEDMFKKALTNKLTQTARIQFHGYLRFLILNKEDRSGFFQWMRVVRNLSENTALNTTEDVVRAIKSLESILPFSNSILDFLCTEENKVDFFFSRQIQEERIKAHLILKKGGDGFKTAIERFENRAFFAGQLGFILEFSGILDYYELNHNCNWSDTENVSFLSKFIEYAEKASVVFEILQTPKNLKFLLERGVLTKGNYLVPATYDRLNFLSTTKDQRDYSWKRLLRLPATGESESAQWKERRSFVKELLDDKRIQLNNIQDSLEKICLDNVGGWRQYFIDQPEFIGYCQQGFIQMKSEHEIYLVLQFQDNSRKRELYSFNLYNKLPDDFGPFEELFHAEINRDNEYSNVKFANWCYNRKYYSMNVYYFPTEDEQDGYFSVWFYKAKGDTQRKEYANELITFLEKKGFEWDEDEPGFVCYVETEKATNDFLTELRVAFNVLDK